MANRLLTLIVQGLDKGGAKALQGVESAASSLSGGVGKAEKALGQLTTSLTSHLPAGGAQAKAALDKVGGSLLQGVENMGALKVATLGLAVVGGAALAKFASDGIGAFVSGTAEVRKLKATLGDTAEEASGLRNVAVGLGVDVDTLAKGMFKLVGNVNAAKGELAGVHVEIAQGKGGNVDYGKTLDNLRTAYQSLTDPAAKNQFLLEAFKKTGMDLRPILSATNDEFERMKKAGPIFSDKDLQAGRDYSISQRELGQATKAFEVDLARGLVPAITTVTGLLTSGIQAADRMHVPLVQLGIAAGVTAVGLHALAAAEAEAGLGMVGTIGIYGAATVAAKAEADSNIQLVASHEKRTGVLGVLDSVLGAHIGKSKEAAQADKDHAKAAQEHDAAVAELTDTTERLGISLSAEEVATGKATAEHQKAISTIEGYAAALDVAYAATGASSEDLVAHEGELAHSFYEANTAAGALKTGLDLLTGTHVSAQRAAIDEEEKVAALTKTLDENGRTLDITTDAGRKNQGAILDLITATGTLATAMTQEGDTNEQVTATYNAHIAQLRGVLSAAGLTEDQIQALIDKYHLVPPDVSTAVSAPGAANASGQVADLHGQLNALPSYKEVRIVTYEETHKDVYGTGSYGPGYASGGMDDFGPGTLAMLHGREVILPLADPKRSAELLLESGLAKPYAGGGFTHTGASDQSGATWSPEDRVRSMAASAPMGVTTWAGGTTATLVVPRGAIVLEIERQKLGENVRDFLIDLTFTHGDLGLVRS